MNEGAFGFFDCLGFKGVWNRGVQPDQIIKFLETAKADSKNMPLVETVKNILPSIGQSTVFISDTVATSVHPKSPVDLPDFAKGYLVHLSAIIAVELSVAFSSAPVPLVFRGVITYGSHLAHESFILGPAVDQAAELAETSQGAFIWLDPIAQDLYRRYLAKEEATYLKLIDALSPHERIASVNRVFKSLLAYSPTLAREELEAIVGWWNRLNEKQKHDVSPIVLTECWRPTRGDSMVKDYPVDLKQGGTLRADVVNPLFRIAPQNHAAWIDRVLGSFGGTALDVMLKKQNTARFLEHASKLTTEAVALTRANILKAQESAVRLTGVTF